MTRRMFLAVPSDPMVPEGRHITYLPGGLMVDLSADMRCATCRFFLPSDEENGYENYCIKMVSWSDMVLTDPDFGCKAWQPKDVTQTYKNPEQTGDTICPTCHGTGYMEHVNWHETEVWDCPDCKGKRK